VSDDARKLVLVLLAAAVVAALLVALLPKWLGSAAGPEVEIVTALKRAEQLGFELDLKELGTVTSSKANFDRISVEVHGDQALATATLDFDGKLGEATTVSSLGLERIPFHFKDGEWEPEKGFAPRLAGIVSMLERRRRALEDSSFAGLCYDASILPKELETLLNVKRRKLRATTWAIRSEREDVLISEDYHLTGELPERPVDDVGTRRLTLELKDGDLCFTHGLM
jgi:hypothetical protein